MFRHFFSPPKMDRQTAQQIEALQTSNAELGKTVAVLREHNTVLYEDKLALLAFIKSLPDSISKTKGGSDILKQRDALVKQAEEEQAL